MVKLVDKPVLKTDYLTNYRSWDEYMAYIWAALIKANQYHKHATIIELAPGTSTKIGLALKQCQFKGTLYVIEPSKHSLMTIIALYQKLIPEAQILPIEHDLASALPYLPQNADYLLSNHPLDDMLMAQYLTNTQQSALFGWTNFPCGEVSPSFQQRWQDLMKEPVLLKSKKEELLQQWTSFVSKIMPQTLIISQYPSIALQNNQLQSLNLHSNALLMQLKQNLELFSDQKQTQEVLDQFKNVDDLHIRNEVLNATNWLMSRN